MSPPSTPTRVVVDCSADVGSQAVADSLARVVARKVADGDLDGARAVMEQAERERARAGLARVSVVPLTAEEVAQREADIAAAQVDAARVRRADRTARLAASDWTMLPDAPLTDAERAAWAAYRQALRDLRFDTDPVWPEPPGSIAP